ncbi:MAG: alanyl-tRNA editing protein AlaX [Promethearchaeia archaeon]|nr:MAG: alanyl-tRNA editing protein AlaX [Candidatus Lokiarchaeia archaeon]
MKDPIYLNDMYLKEFISTVKSVDEENHVYLDQTAFYPRSGGVDGDQGELIRKNDGKSFMVILTGKKQGEIYHQVNNSGLHKGDKIIGKLDWARRYELMRYHTAAHVLSGVFWHEGQVKITGNNLEVGKGRIDFNFPNFDRGLVEHFVEKANEYIRQDLPVTVYYISRQELDSDPNMTKLAMGLPKSIKNVRIVDITIDKQPDGGCHVKSLGEIGTIQITNIKNKGKNNRRLYFTLI